MSHPIPAPGFGQLTSPSDRRQCTSALSRILREVEAPINSSSLQCSFGEQSCLETIKRTGPNPTSQFAKQKYHIHGYINSTTTTTLQSSNFEYVKSLISLGKLTIVGQRLIMPSPDHVAKITERSSAMHIKLCGSVPITSILVSLS